jgi:hypothetical protein
VRRVHQKGPCGLSDSIQFPLHSLAGLRAASRDCFRAATQPARSLAASCRTTDLRVRFPPDQPSIDACQAPDRILS